MRRRRAKTKTTTIECRLVAHPLVVYRLIEGERPEESDFQRVRLLRAEKGNVPELLRLGLSHYREPEQARAVLRRPGSRIARLRLAPGGRPIYYANTYGPGHVTVWAGVEQLLEAVQDVGD
jgi:hypothetical protein